MRERTFPFRKARSDLDVGLPDGSGDEGYLAALRRGAGRALAPHGRHRRPASPSTWPAPTPHEGDRLGRLKLTHRAGLAARDRARAGRRCASAASPWRCCRWPAATGGTSDDRAGPPRHACASRGARRRGGSRWARRGQVADNPGSMNSEPLAPLPPRTPRPASPPTTSHFGPITTRWIGQRRLRPCQATSSTTATSTRVVNRLLVEAGALDLERRHRDRARRPDAVRLLRFDRVSRSARSTAGVGVSRIRRSSVRYEIGPFADDSPVCAAAGHFIHVYVDRLSRRRCRCPSR